jgi:hypothetical protein
MCSAIDIIRQKVRCALGRAACSNPSDNLWGITLSGETTREAPAQAELRPTCADSFKDSIRVWAEWPGFFEAFGVLVVMGGTNPHIFCIGIRDLLLNPALL